MMRLLNGLEANVFYTFAVVAFIAMVLLIEGLYLLWSAYRGPEAKRVSRRLQALSAGSYAAESSLLRQHMLSRIPKMDQWLLRVPRIHSFDRFLVQSGLGWSVGRFVLMSLLCGLGAALLIALIPTVSLVFALMGGLGASCLPWAYVVRKRLTRLHKFEEQLPDALDLIGRALRAGHAFPSGLKMAGEEMPDPIGTELRMTHDEVNFGVSVPQALLNLGARIPSTDLRYFVVAVLIQRETGGNLTEVLGNLSALIRARLKLLGKIRVLSAEGRLSGWILSLLPFFLGGVLYLINPKFMAVLWTDPLGHKLIGTALALMFLGILWMRKIIRIHV